MTMNIMYFFISILIICMIIESQKSWRILLIAIAGLISIALNLTDLIDFNLSYAIPMTLGTIVYTGYKLIVTATYKIRDNDEFL